MVATANRARRRAEHSMSALEWIAQWSDGQPQWLQDATRRLVVNAKLSRRDLDELVSLCMGEFGVDQPNLQPIPLQSNQIPSSASSSRSISLISISDVDGVNHLASDQRLEFGPAGVTIIYGDNGAGKTGYSRILKRACRARMRGEIIPDVFDEEASKVAAATIRYRAGRGQVKSIEWEDGDDPHPILSAVNVFDQENGEVHIRKPTDIQLRPFGLDIPDKLARACNYISDQLVAEQDYYENSYDSDLDIPADLQNTRVGDALEYLHADTKMSKFRSLAKLSEEDLLRHKRLAKILKENTDNEIERQELYLQTLVDLLETIRYLSDRCSDKELTALKRKSDAARKMREKASTLANKTFNKLILGGLGEHAWREFWEAGRTYSEEAAYSGQEFPVTDVHAVCILCLQKLDKEAKTRLKKFENFVQSDEETDAEHAEEEFQTAMEGCIESPFPQADLNRGVRSLAARDTKLAQRVKRYVETLRRRLHTTEQAIESGKRLVLSPLRSCPTKGIEAAIREARREIKQLRDANDPERRAKLEQKRDELSARIWLKGKLAKLDKEVIRLQRLEALEAAKESTDTRKVTRLGNQLADEYVTRRVRQTFDDEISALTGSSAYVEKQRVGGRVGVPRFQVRFSNAPEENRMDKVLSEGEKTSIALAAFLAELAFAEHTSAIVFDDPVSSLDHKWQRRLSRRLVEKGADQQVIIFTHDLVFAQGVHFYAEKNKVECRIVSLSTKHAGSGVVSDGFPWEGTNVNGRKIILRKLLSDARRLHERNESDRYEKKVRLYYTRLRSTWERALEEVAFGNTVVRFREHINHANLMNASVLDKADCRAYMNNHKRCSGLIDAHDFAPGKGHQVPFPAELQDDLDALENWVDSLKKRQRELR